MAILALLQADARVAARLTAALSPDHEVAMLPSWEPLTERGGHELDGCIVCADGPDAIAAMPEVAELRRERPGLAVLACVETDHGPGYYRLGGLGIAGVLKSTADQPARVRVIVDRALASARAEGVARALEGRFAAPGPDAVAWAVEHAGPDTSVRKLAEALGYTPKALREALDDVGLPAPTRILLWGRLLLAGARLGSDRRTVEEVAFSLGYSTATSLARAMKRQTGLTPREVSVRGGMTRVRDALFPPGAGTAQGTGRAGRIASIALALALGGCAALGTGGRGVDRGAIDDILSASPTNQAHVGVLAVDLRTGRTLYEHEAHRWFVPASNQKILVGAAAWSLLGPDHRFVTDVWATRPARGGRVDGSLVVVGSGDPSLSARYWKSGTAAMEAIADSLRAVGVHDVTGGLLVDATAWDSTTVGPTREVEDLRYGYGSTGGVFSIEEGEFEVVVAGGPSVGGPARVAWSPMGTSGYVQSLVRTSPADSGTRVVSHYLPESRQLVLEGVAEYGTVDTIRVAQRDPVRQAAAALHAALGRAGVRMGRPWSVRWKPGAALADGCQAGQMETCGAAVRLATLRSPPLAELVTGVLGPSQNWMAEQLVRSLGATRGGNGSWSEGLSVIERFLVDEVGVAERDIVARDGSGLSAYNLVTPRAITRVLRYMSARPDGAAFRVAMAEPGEEGSTLEGRLEELQGRVFAKTGTISNVNSLSGYLTRTDGSEVVFSILSNGAGVRSSEMRSTLDDIVRVLAR